MTTEISVMYGSEKVKNDIVYRSVQDNNRSVVISVTISAMRP